VSRHHPQRERDSSLHTPLHSPLHRDAHSASYAASGRAAGAVLSALAQRKEKKRAGSALARGNAEKPIRQA
jgi:hypothetical protein